MGQLWDGGATEVAKALRSRHWARTRQPAPKAPTSCTASSHGPAPLRACSPRSHPNGPCSMTAPPCLVTGTAPAAPHSRVPQVHHQVRATPHDHASTQPLAWPSWGVLGVLIPPKTVGQRHARNSWHKTKSNLSWLVLVGRGTHEAPHTDGTDHSCPLTAS